jgi:phosphocarrier protein
LIEREVEIINRLGLHARAAAKLVHTAGAFESDVTLLVNTEQVDAKSILGILLLAIGQGTELVVRAEGSDEDEAMEAVTTLIAGRFGEES